MLLYRHAIPLILGENGGRSAVLQYYRRVGLAHQPYANGLVLDNREDALALGLCLPAGLLLLLCFVARQPDRNTAARCCQEAKHQEQAQLRLPGEGEVVTGSNLP